MVRGGRADRIPAIETHGQHRKIRQVDQGSGTIGPEQLTGTDLSDEIGTHASPPFAFLTFGFQDGGSVECFEASMIS